MTPEEMVMEPLSLVGDGAEARNLGARWPGVSRASEPTSPEPTSPEPTSPEPTAADGDSPIVPPVRTIVLDRPPTPVRPLQEREAVRRPSYAPGPERLSVRDVSISYA